MKNIIKRIIVGVGIALVLSFINSCEVKAERSPDWLRNVRNTFNVVYFYDIINNSPQDVNLTYFNSLATDGRYYPTWWNALPVTIGNSGVMQTFDVNQRFKEGYLYSLTYYQCHNKVLNYQNTDIILYLGGSSSSISNRPSNTTQYQYTNITEVSNQYMFDGGLSFNYCAQFTSLFVPNTSGNWIGILEKAKSSSITNLTLTHFGYTLEPLGIYDENVRSMLNSVVQNSGFATASSVQQVQNSVNQVQAELDGVQEEQRKTNQKLDTINDSLTSENGPSSDKYSNLSRHNSNDPVINQLITMPITLARAYLNGINSYCTPFNLGSLFGTDLILPCINPGNYLGSLWSVIDVLVSGIFIFTFGKKCVKIFNDVTNLKENQVEEVFD